MPPTPLAALPQQTDRRALIVAASLVVVLLLSLVAVATAPRSAPAPLVAAPLSMSPPLVRSETIMQGVRPLVEPTPTRTPAPRPTPKVRRALPKAKVFTGQRWLPRGTGMWLHDWSRSESGHAPQVVARAQRAGLTHLYVQTGSSEKGWIGETVLSQLMPAVKGSDLKVIAWDFPTLANPEADARRLARAAFWNRKGAPMISAVAPDVETAAEGTRISAEAIRRYYTALRRELPARTAILATVPWPSEQRTGRYPYAATAPFADAFVPMAYWYNRSPSIVTATSMDYLARFGKPVMPVGQGYDGRIDAPYLAPDLAPDKSVAAFSFAARARGAQSISLWSWQTTGPLQWRVLAESSRLFRAGPAPAVSPSPQVVRPPRDLVPGRKPHRSWPSQPASPQPEPAPTP